MQHMQHPFTRREVELMRALAAEAEAKRILTIAHVATTRRDVAVALRQAATLRRVASGHRACAAHIPPDEPIQSLESYVAAHRWHDEIEGYPVRGEVAREIGRTVEYLECLTDIYRMWARFRGDILMGRSRTPRPATAEMPIIAVEA